MASESATVPMKAESASPRLARDVVQRLVDQVACFNVLIVPDGGGDPGGGATGVRGSGQLHPFAIDLRLPSQPNGVRAVNLVGEVLGRVRFRWAVIPHEFFALPEREPPPTLFDPGCSQRFAVQEMEFTLGDGRDGFRAFGTGRTFPSVVAGRPVLLAAGVANLTQGNGRFAGCVGNLTLCGRVNAGGFYGHAIIRVVDPDGRLRSSTPTPAPAGRPAPDGDLTFLMWAAQKGKTSEEENRFSRGPDGQVRGMNIPVRLRHLVAGIDLGAGGPQATGLRIGDPVGMEIGFGRGSIPDAPPTGTPRAPYQFEGVAQYSFQDRQRRPVGAMTTNVVEGRRFDVSFPAAPGVTGWRFGFFGPIVFGSGALRGVRGLFYGASGSVFEPPPGDHVVTHLYAACLDDPGGRFRAAAGDEC